MVTTASGVSYPLSAMNELLRAYVPSVYSRVFYGDAREDSHCPRITINALTPTEKIINIGECFGSGSAVWLDYIFKVDIWSRKAGECNDTAGEVIYAISKHRHYAPTDATKGYFTLLKTAGGSNVELNPAKGLFQRTINISGRWLSLASEKWF